MPANQRGAALLVTLVMVALVSMLALAISDSTRVQQQLSANEAARQMAFQAAEAGLRSAELAIDGSGDLGLFCNAGGERYNITTRDGLDNDAHWQSLERAGAVADFTLYSSASGDFMPAPRYMIGCIAPSLVDGYQEVDPAVKGQAEEATEQRYFFRVFSVGFGPGGRAVQRLEARYVY
ncbi:PilX N-terminal domain-containing pilus assembly protein [Salinicola sp.]|uniref:pilus assembly PilX family protein n=1 Tax=Salinicola sp. TaxID=1978524 RepID=UPI0025F2C35C|nr:PilX N-terminal domain-containing pilus assembly protein [Salinicola sp.]